MYNERPRDPAFRRVTFCLVGVATPNELIKDPRTTPFNVGRTIELTDFAKQQPDDVDRVARLYGMTLEMACKSDAAFCRTSDASAGQIGE